jgi:hypothetical protein
LGGRRAECGCSFGPGVVRIAICSLGRIGEGWNFVQFIVLMDWIRFHGTEAGHSEESERIAEYTDAARAENSWQAHRKGL